MNTKKERKSLSYQYILNLRSQLNNLRLMRSLSHDPDRVQYVEREIEKLEDKLGPDLVKLPPRKAFLESLIEANETTNLASQQALDELEEALKITFDKEDREREEEDFLPNGSGNSEPKLL